MSLSPKVQQELKNFEQRMEERENALKDVPEPKLQPSSCYDLFVDYMKCHVSYLLLLFYSIIIVSLLLFCRFMTDRFFFPCRTSYSTRYAVL
jgi:hypothetical protein